MPRSLTSSGQQEELIPHLSPGFLLSALNIAWLLDFSLESLPPCVCVLWGLLSRMPATGLRARLNPL